MTTTVLIAGAGIGGLCAALMLAQQGLKVTVFEQAEQLSEVGAGLQISPNAMQVLRALGLEAALRPFAFVPDAASIRHYRTGQFYLRVPLAQTMMTRYGAPYWHVHRADLHQVLVQASIMAGVDIQLSAKIVDFQQTPQHVTVILSDQSRHQGAVLIGADGVRSTILALLQRQIQGFGQASAPSFTGQVAWRGVIPATSLPTGLIKPEATVWAGPGKHLVSYYLRGGTLVNFVAVEERAAWVDESWSLPGDVGRLRQAFSGWHPEVSQLLEAVDRTFLWGLFSRPPLARWHHQRVVLMGDACHPMLPFMAQGAAMAIEDAYVLAKSISQSLFDVQPLESALHYYTQQRLPRATQVQSLSRANASLYHLHGGIWGLARLQAMQLATKAIPALIHAKLDPLYGTNVVTK